MITKRCPRCSAVVYQILIGEDGEMATECIVCFKRSYVEVKEIHVDKKREIADVIRTMIMTGELSYGDLLPPARAMAEYHGVETSTATYAYQILSKENLVRSKNSAGTLVIYEGTINPERGRTYPEYGPIPRPLERS